MGPTFLLRIALTSMALTGVAASQSYAVTGILSSVDGSSIPHGHLSATLTGGAMKQHGSFSEGDATSSASEADEHGHFTMRLQAPGRWRITASARGFQSAALDEHDGFFTGVVITAAKPSVDISLRLAPDSSIDGYILDEAGEAVRNAAQVTLMTEDEADSDQAKTSWKTRASTRPDDRGHYEFSGLGAGRYEVMVQATPWYAAGASRRGAQPQNDPANALPTELPLDVAYPLIWYPSVTEPSAASILTLHSGDARQADLRLFPVPSIHLRISTPAVGEGSRADTNVPQIRLITPDGVSRNQSGRIISNLPGQTDIGGLAPGTYEVIGSGDERQSSLLRIGPGSPRTLDLSAALPLTPVSVHCDLPTDTVVPEVHFTDMETGRITPQREGREERDRGTDYLGGYGLNTNSVNGRVGSARMREDRGLRQRGDRVVELASGRYEVSITGDQGQYLVDLTASGAELAGRIVTIHGGTPKLNLHVGLARATLSGVATLRQRPAAGAIVLLVPATLGETGSMSIVRREQTDTDGSFQLSEITPDRYILVAIDHGWNVNWHDSSTLNRYLLHGIPIDLTAVGTLRQSVEAQLP